MTDHFSSSGENRRSEDPLVERLIGLADPGPEIPVDGADRIKESIRPHWERQVRTRRWRRRAVLGAGIAAALFLIVGGIRVMAPPGGRAVEPERVADVEVLRGQVEVTGPGGAVNFLTEIGSGVVAGSRLRTGSDGRVALRLAGGESLRIDRDTVLRFDSASAFELEGGAVYADSAHQSGSNLLIVTAIGTVREVGTQFEVRDDGGPFAVLVREGMITLNMVDELLEVAAGNGVAVAADGSVVREPIGAADSRWDWVVDLAPTFELEGATAIAFLEWFSRETGIGVEFPTVEIEALVRGTTLHGSLSGVSPAEAPDVVLASCGLEAVQESDRLLVRPARE